MSIWERVTRIFKAEANSAVDTLEDPVKISQQILRDLRDNLQEAINGTSEIKAMAAQRRASEAEARTKASEWEKKANELLDRMEAKQIDEATANKLAADCLEHQQTYSAKAEEFKTLAEREEKAASVMEAKVEEIRRRITETESKAASIASRAKTAEAQEKVAKTLSSVDTDGLMQTLNRMEEKTKATEFRTQAYAEIDGSASSTEDQVNKILNQSSPNAALEALKAKRKAEKGV